MPAMSRTCTSERRVVSTSSSEAPTASASIATGRPVGATVTGACSRIRAKL